MILLPERAPAQVREGDVKQKLAQDAQICLVKLDFALWFAKSD